MTPTPDPGAAAERTRLAWRRTGLSATAVGLLAARPAFRPGAGVLAWLIAALAMAGWVAMIALAYRRSHGLRSAPPRPGRRLIPVYALLAAGLAVLGGLVVML
ncbi:DUF202 domain-containing protein [Actinoplanes subtropicus]|uniref:DUF202 domain-containing protein n=1 Tax=Actinoplanes subtropicus TaxID=543632 RepID=UPI0004C2B48A|nr:DUF202 domain-containing protein [Actinoplanes subtropicus]